MRGSHRLSTDGRLPRGHRGTRATPVVLLTCVALAVASCTGVRPTPAPSPPTLSAHPHSPDTTHWLFGYWNAEFLTEHGLQVNAVHAPTLADSSEADLQRCTSTDAYRGLTPLGASYEAPDPRWATLAVLAHESYRATVTDQRFRGLVDDVRACVAQHGHEADPTSELGTVKVGPDWDDGRPLAALVQEARCRDQLEFTQKAADLAAEVQAPLIDANPETLMAIRQEATERIARANSVLTSVGLR